MPRFQPKPKRVYAEQWFPGSMIPDVFIAPHNLVGVPGANIGHQRELADGKHGYILTSRGLELLSPGDWIVGPREDRSVCSNKIFSETYAPLEPGKTMTQKRETDVRRFVNSWLKTEEALHPGENSRLGAAMRSLLTELDAARSARADAWDEGYRAGSLDESNYPVDPKAENPYR